MGGLPCSGGGNVKVHTKYWEAALAMTTPWQITWAKFGVLPRCLTVQPLQEQTIVYDNRSIRRKSTF